MWRTALSAIRTVLRRSIRPVRWSVPPSTRAVQPSGAIQKSSTSSARLVEQFLVGAQEDAQDVPAADDADEPTRAVHHRQPLDPLLLETPGGLGDVLVGGD